MRRYNLLIKCKAKSSALSILKHSLLGGHVGDFQLFDSYNKYMDFDKEQDRFLYKLFISEKTYIQMHNAGKLFMVKKIISWSVICIICVFSGMVVGGIFVKLKYGVVIGGLCGLVLPIICYIFYLCFLVHLAKRGDCYSDMNLCIKLDDSEVDIIADEFITVYCDDTNSGGYNFYSTDTINLINMYKLQKILKQNPKKYNNIIVLIDRIISDVTSEERSNNKLLFVLHSFVKGFIVGVIISFAFINFYLSSNFFPEINGFDILSILIPCVVGLIFATISCFFDIFYKHIEEISESSITCAKSVKHNDNEILEQHLINDMVIC